jgi:hypothetical protein
VDGTREEFGLPLSLVFSLLHDGLSSALQAQDDLNARHGEQGELLDKWKAWRAVHWVDLGDGRGKTKEQIEVEAERDELNEELEDAHSRIEALDELHGKLATQTKLLDEKISAETEYKKQIRELQRRTKNINTLSGLVGLLLIGLAAFAVTIWPTLYRYDRLASLPVRINRFTGKAEVLSTDGWNPLEKSAVAAKESSDIVPLPPDERHKLTGKAGWCSVPEWVCVNLYNGTTWEIQEVTFLITAKRDDGTNEWQRRFQEEYPHLAPFSSEEMIVKTGERGKPKFSWTIIAAKGRSPQ